MLERRRVGEVPPKPHLRARTASGGVLYEECLTRAGFDGAFSMLYREHRPHEALPVSASVSLASPELVPPRALLRRHYRCLELAAGATSVEARTPLLANRDVTVGFLRPTAPDSVYFSNADGDELLFVHAGSGVLRSAFGDLAFQSGDYVYVPRGVLHRLLPTRGRSRRGSGSSFRACSACRHAIAIRLGSCAWTPPIRIGIFAHRSGFRRSTRGSASSW
jgi:homogentisate 1,2-dioxygenase